MLRLVGASLQEKGIRKDQISLSFASNRTYPRSFKIVTNEYQQQRANI